MGEQAEFGLNCAHKRLRAYFGSANEFANERCGTVHLDRGEPSAGGCNGVAFSCVSLLSNPQCVQLGLESTPINHRRC